MTEMIKIFFRNQFPDFVMQVSDLFYLEVIHHQLIGYDNRGMSILFSDSTVIVGLISLTPYKFSLLKRPSPRS